MQNTAQDAKRSGILHERRGPERGSHRSVGSNLLSANTSAPAASNWHGSRDLSGMIPLLLTFFLIGTLMCGLIALELQPDKEPAPRRRPRRSGKYSHPATSKVELPTDIEVEFGHTAKGSARGK